jgi:FkbM family methyltransferase
MFATISNLWRRRSRQPLPPQEPLRFYGQFDPPQDQVLYETYFKHSKPGVFLECGAFDGKTESSCFFFEETLGWTGVNVEACPIIYEKLVANRPHSRNFCLALSDHEGEATFSLAVHPTFGQLCTNGSLTHTEQHKQHLIDIGCSFEQYQVKLVTYKTLLSMANISRLDLFVLDVEGHELSVLDGMIDAPIMPRVFCIEHGWIDNDTLDTKLSKLGFHRDRIVHNNLVYLHKTY